MVSLTRIFKFINQHPLAKKHKIRAYYNFIKWQFSQYPNPHEKTVPFVEDTKLYVKKGLTGATGNIYTGLLEFNDMGFLLHFLTPGDLFFDIGANVGAYTILAAGCKKSRVIAFEPVPSTFVWLQKNIDINQIKALVMPYNIGIGSEKGNLYFTTSYDTVNHVLPESATSKENSVEVIVETFDNITLAEGVPILVKVDVEGFETEVITGMKESLRSAGLKAIIIELNGSGKRYGYDERKIHEVLCDHGFRPFDYDPIARQLSLLKSFGLFNTIYIRDLEFVKHRIANASRITLFAESF